MTGHVLRLAAAATLGGAGVLSALSGVVGVLRMPDLYTRIQCATKNVTLGAIPTLAAIVVAKGPISPYGSRALLLVFLLLVASPMASYALARAAYRVGIPMWPGAVIDQAAQARQQGAGATGDASERSDCGGAGEEGGEDR